jgi:hypothetical protein
MPDQLPGRDGRRELPGDVVRLPAVVKPETIAEGLRDLVLGSGAQAFVRHGLKVATNEERARTSPRAGMQKAASKGGPGQVQGGKAQRKRCARLATHIRSKRHSRLLLTPHKLFTGP